MLNFPLDGLILEHLLSNLDNDDVKLMIIKLLEDYYKYDNEVIENMTILLSDYSSKYDLCLK